MFVYTTLPARRIVSARLAKSYRLTDGRTDRATDRLTDTLSYGVVAHDQQVRIHDISNVISRSPSFLCQPSESVTDRLTDQWTDTPSYGFVDRGS